MRKDEAAKLLGVSTRTLELYTKQGRIGGHYEKGKTRPVLIYDEAEVKRLKDELAGQNYAHRPVVERAIIDSGVVSTSTPFSGADVSIVPTSPQMEHLLAALASIGAARPQSASPEVPIHHKLFLSLDEAQALTGLSRGVLREAIKTNELPAKIIGRGWRIRRTDLDAFAQSMSMDSQAPKSNRA